MGPTGGHEAKHLNKGPGLELVEILFGQLGSPVKSHFRHFIIGFFEKVLVIQSYRMVSLIERQVAGLEFLSSFDCSEHRV